MTATSAQRVALISVAAAAVLVAIKLLAGLLAGSLALIAEAAHSGSDLVAALLTFVALRVAVRPADAEHTYGHGKAEHLAALGEGAFLLVVSGVIGLQALRRLVTDLPHDVHATFWTFAALALALAIDTTRLIALRRGALRHGSAALEASAVHFASDLLGTLAVIGGLIFTAVGFPAADAIAAIAVTGLVIIAALRLMSRNVEVLMDRAPAGAEQLVYDAVALADPHVVLKRVRVRSAADRRFVEITVGYEGDAGLGESHLAADRAEAAIAAAMPGSDVIVHVEPQTESSDLRARATAAGLSVAGIREIHNVRVIDIDGHLELSLHIKMPTRTQLSDAHNLATELERAIAADLPELEEIQTHIEPLSPPVKAGRPSELVTAPLRATIEALIDRLPTAELRALRFRRSQDGLVALLTIALDGDLTVDDAHAIATNIEHRLRRAIPALDAVIVHTEPTTTDFNEEERLRG